jgi:cytochrome c-type biogenesis protein CcmH
MPSKREPEKRASSRGGQIAIVLVVILLVIATLMQVSRSRAQDAVPVTFDDVNAVAALMYCPECENIPLDKCFTSVCIQWKREIAAQLGEGSTPQQIVDDFVQRFGDQVVGVPHDPTLRALSLVVPLVLAVLAGGVGLWTIFRLRARPTEVSTTTRPDFSKRDPYRALLERDLDDER